MNKMALNVVGCIAVAAVALVSAGCSSPPATPAPIYGAVNPGPWKDVRINIGAEVGKVTVRVEDYRASTADFVWKIGLTNESGDLSLGNRVFVYGQDPQETFLVGGRAKTVVVTVISTVRGTWRSPPVTLPEPPVTPIAPK